MDVDGVYHPAQAIMDGLHMDTYGSLGLPLISLRYSFPFAR